MTAGHVAPLVSTPVMRNDEHDKISRRISLVRQIPSEIWIRLHELFLCLHVTTFSVGIVDFGHTRNAFFSSHVGLALLHRYRSQ